jgi:hypothetical protein
VFGPSSADEVGAVHPGGARSFDLWRRDQPQAKHATGLMSLRCSTGRFCAIADQTNADSSRSTASRSPSTCVQPYRSLRVRTSRFDTPMVALIPCRSITRSRRMAAAIIAPLLT